MCDIVVFTKYNVKDEIRVPVSFIGSQFFIFYCLSIICETPITNLKYIRVQIYYYILFITYIYIVQYNNMFF